ncbi:MAG: carboxypeptidase regulatory-like domain-containing protein, partial [Acidobacteria bacterium]|nr:carboxypeptidase regulatory-like domain-containing protein [Acidobacteriota bacterium]
MARQPLVAAFAATSAIWTICIVASAQSPERGSISGRVTADQGEVRAFRVAAHNLDQRLWYVVFTKDGAYTVPQALPGRYEVTVWEPGFDAPTVPVQLRGGDRTTADLRLQRTQARGEGNGAPNARPVVYVDTMEEIFPPGPGQELVREHCVGCHRDGASWRNARTYDEFLRGIERMAETGPANNPYVLAVGRTPFGARQKALMAEYLFRHFGTDQPLRRLRIDPLLLDEEVASKAIYVLYDIPADLPKQPSAGNQLGADMIDGVVAQSPAPTLHHLQAAAISPVDGSIWFSNRVSNAVLRLDPKERDPVKRWRNYPIKGNNWVAVSGITIDSQGKVYWSELQGGMMGELDPVTGRQIRHFLPHQGVGVGIIADKDDNIGFALIWGSQFGRLDAKTRQVHMDPTPTPDTGIYGLAVDERGNLWGAGWQKGTINKWDAETQLVTEYRVPSAWGQIRRMGVDSKGMVWGSGYNVGSLFSLDPQSGRITEYKSPVSGGMPYEAWPDTSDNVWSADEVHSALIKLDPRTGRFTFYPMPQPRQSVPKMEVEANNTLWFGTRGVPTTVGVHFYPEGYTA